MQIASLTHLMMVLFLGQGAHFSSDGMIDSVIVQGDAKGFRWCAEDATQKGNHQPPLDGFVRGKVEAMDDSIIHEAQVATLVGSRTEWLVGFTDVVSTSTKLNSRGEFWIHLPKAPFVKLSVTAPGYEGASAIYSGGEHCVHVLLVPVKWNEQARHKPRGG